jgi:hypothetical protein
VLANATTIAVNLDGNAISLSSALARGKGGPVTALSSAKAIALNQAVSFFCFDYSLKTGFIGRAVDARERARAPRLSAPLFAPTRFFFVSFC